MESVFHQKLDNWYQASKQGLSHRPSKKEEWEKRQKLWKFAELQPDFSINMVNVCGVYNVVGGNPVVDKSYYTGLLHVDLVSNQIEASWLIEGEQQQVGYGFVFNNTLIISFSYWAEKELYNGIVAYDFLTPEIVIGKWTEEIAIENAFEMGRKLSSKELGMPNPTTFFSKN